MKAQSFTKRELKIIRTKKPLSISCEEYLAICRKAHFRDKIQILNHLWDMYPEISQEVNSEDFEETHGDPADMEDCCRFPILLPTMRYTQARVMDMVAYLLGKIEAPKEYANMLPALVPYRMVFNYFSDEYVADFRTGPLWENFFLVQAELRRVLELRSIESLEELEVRACNYFERLLSRH